MTAAPDKKPRFDSGVQYIDLGVRFSLAILLCAGGGYWLDKKLHTVPLFLILGLLLGATTGFVTIYRAVYPPKAAKRDDGE